MVEEVVAEPVLSEPLTSSQSPYYPGYPGDVETTPPRHPEPAESRIEEDTAQGYIIKASLWPSCALREGRESNTSQKAVEELCLTSQGTMVAVCSQIASS